MTGKRVLTAVVLVPLVVSAVWFGPPWLVAVLVGVVILLSLQEFFEIADKAGLQGYRRWTMFCSAAIVLAQWDSLQFSGIYDSPQIPVLGIEITLELILLTFILGAGAVAASSPRNVQQSLGSMAISTGALLFVALPFSYLIRLRGSDEHGGMLLFVLGLVWVGDTAAYFVGSGLGKHPLAAQISPKKTWEGAIGNLLATLLVAAGAAWGMNWWMEEKRLIPVVHFLAFGAIVSIAGQIGDLAESAYKRSAGVKDSGSILPGHGGMLDRIDSLIFAAPAVWCYAKIVSSLH